MDKQAKTGRGNSPAPPRYSLVFWDWNGTLLDDLTYAIGVRNRTFPRFGLSRVESVEEYYEQFTFPIRLYYERAGGTDENFEEVAHAWMDEYVRGMGSVPLHPDALRTLTAFQNAGIAQVVLSASNTEVLTKQLEQHRLMDFLSAVLGLSHIYATSKQAIGEAYLRGCGVSPDACVLLGDTLHDAEVARAMGVQCVLVAGGHQSEAALLTAGCPVYRSLQDAAEFVLTRTKPNG